MYQTNYVYQGLFNSSNVSSIKNTSIVSTTYQIIRENVYNSRGRFVILHFSNVGWT